MRAISLILVALCVLSAAASSQEKPRSFPAPLTGHFSPSAIDSLLARKPAALIPAAAAAEPAPSRARQPLGGVRPDTEWPASSDLNATAPFLYGSTYVIQIFVHDGGGSWKDSSWNPFEYTRDTQAAMVSQATTWLQGQAPSHLSVSFNTSNTTTYHYYNATISSTIGMGSPEDWMSVDVPTAIGFTDEDGDGDVLDDLLEYVRTLDGGGWDNVIAVFHFNHSGRSFAFPDIAGCANFTTNSMFGFNVATCPRTYAHEMTHLYGASDEYLDHMAYGSCADGDCNTDFVNIWLTPTYKNGNCSSCGHDGKCLMRWVAENMLNGDVDLCSDTKKHIGWGDDDNNGYTDLEDSAPWAEFTSTPFGGTIDSTFTAEGMAYLAYRWGRIGGVEYSIDDGTWKNATAKDGSFNSFQEAFVIKDTLRTDGKHTIRVRAKTSRNIYQAGPIREFTVRVDRTGPNAPRFVSSIPSDTTSWTEDRNCSFSWDEPFDSSGVSGYSYAFDKSPSTIPPATINATNKFADVIATSTGRWYMHVRAVDPLGNWGATSHWLAKVDLTPPSAPVVTSTTHPGSAYSNKKVASISWKSTDAQSGVKGYNYSGTLDQDPTATVPTWQCVSDTTVDLSVPVPPDGAYYFHVRAKDKAGNWGPVAHFKIQADMTPPTLTVTAGTHPDPNTWYIANEANFSWKETVSDLSGIAGYSYAETLGVAGVNPRDKVNTFQNSADLSNLASGVHYFAVQALDNAGNWGSAVPGGKGIARVTIRVDQTPPDTVTGLHSPDHSNAIGKWDCSQSTDKTVEVAWTPAHDAHSGIGGYSIVWNHSRTTGPIKWATLDSTATSATSYPLSDATDWYCHIRTVDKVGNWGTSFATIGPFYIKTGMPDPPAPYAATVGDASVTMRWPRVAGVHHATYKLYRRDKNGSYGSPVATGITDTTYTQSWPNVKNGDIYYYVVTTVDSCGIESRYSYESIAAPEYTTPNTGRHWTLTDLVNNSKGGIRDTSPNFTMHGTVTVAATDTIVPAAGNSLTSMDDSGTKKLDVKGTLIAHGTAASSIYFTGSAKAGSWGGLLLENPGATSLIDHCKVQFAVTGITWSGGVPRVTNSTVEWMSAGGISASPLPAAACIIDTNTVRQCLGTGIYIFATPNSTSRAAKNTVYVCGTGIVYDMNVAAPAPLALTVANNTVRNNTGDGIGCGNGASNTTVTGNTVLENQNGIVFDGEGWFVATPVVSSNQISGNRTAGIHTGMQAAPLIQNNTIVQNGSFGLYSRTDARPSVSGNTITGSQYGVMVQNSPNAVPDLGNPQGGSPGTNRLDGHKLWWVWNAGGAVMNAKNNYWGSAQANPAAVIGGPSATLWNPVWNLPNQAPFIAITAPNGGTATDNVAITWNDGHGDPDDAKINLYYDNNNVGLDGTQIAGAADLSQQSATNQFSWNTKLIPAGTYWVYALISDNAVTRNAYSPGSITIQHPHITVPPDSLHATAAPGATQLDTLIIGNTGSSALNVHLHSSASWLVLTDTIATVNHGASHNATFTWNASGISDGTVSTGHITLTSDDHADSLIYVPARFTVQTGTVALSATSIAFGGVAVDSTRVDTLKIYNTGSASLRLTSASTSPPFSVVGPTLPRTLAHGDTLIMSVSYKPTHSGASSGTLTLHTSDPADPTLDVPLTGTGLASGARLAQSSHAFGTVAVGSTASWDVYVGNTGTSALVVSSATFDSSGFSLESPALAASIPAGDSIRLTVGFGPAEARHYGDTLRISTNDASKKKILVRLTGMGAHAEARLSAGSIVFGSVRTGSSATDSLWVRNVGKDTLRVLSAAASGSFSYVSPALPAQVLAGDSLKLRVRYSPTSADSAFSTLYVKTGASTTPVLDASLSGLGLAPRIAVLDTALAFGPVHADSSRTLRFRVKNTGTATLSVSALSLRVGARFQLVPHSLPAAVPPGDTVSFSATMRPSPVGSYTDTVSIASDDPQHPVVTARLAGSAVAPEAEVFRVTTSGTGVHEDNLLPDGFDFGSTTLGEKKREVFRLRNGGGYPLRLASLSASPARFALDDTLALPLTIAPGAFRSIAVSYLTDSLVSHSGYLLIGTNDRETPSISVPLAGHGSAAIAGLYPTSINEVVFEGDTSRCHLNLTNTGENYYPYIVKERAKSTALVAAKDPGDADWKATQLSAARETSIGRALLSKSVSWLTAIDTLGMVPGRDTVKAAVSLAATPVGAGVYDAELLLLTDKAGKDSTTIPVRMRVPRMRYADHVTGAFRATVTDEGAFGFYDSGQSQAYGSGFIYPASGGESLLFHGSLWVGKDTLHVSDESYDYNFEVMQGGKLTIGGTDPERSFARFTDAQAPWGLGLQVGQECLSYPEPGRDDFLIVKYTIKNTSGSTLSRVYAGIWLDWDIGLYRNDRGGFRRSVQTGYMYNTVEPGKPYAGITILSPARCASFHLIYNPTYQYPYGTIRDKDKYRFLSDKGVDTTAATTQDWSMVMSAGPFTIAAGDSVRVSFAIVGGSTLQALLDNAAAARDLMATPVEPEPLAARLKLEQCYPNPFNPTTRIDFETPRAGMVQLAVFNVNGEVVARVFEGHLPAGRHTVTWDGRTAFGSPAASGVYFYRLSAERCPSLTRKMVLLR